MALTIESLTVAYGPKEAVRNASLHVAPGTLAVLYGPSGCGKTTLCQAVCGIIPGGIKARVTGDILLFGQSIQGRSLAQISREAAYAFQEPEDQMVCTTVEDELAFGLENRRLPPALIREKVETALAAWQLAPLRLRDPATLSGGQKRLVALLSLLITGPRLLVLDEPLSHLDEAGRQLMLNTLRRLRREGTAILVVEHDLSQLAWADQWIAMEAGRVILQGAPRELAALQKEAGHAL